MIVNTFEIQNSIINALSTDPVLASCISKFSIGDMALSRKRFPFIELGSFSYTESQLMAASGKFTYKVDIYAGTRSMAPRVAFQGSDSGKKGVSEICSYILDIVKNNTFSDVFFVPPYSISVNPSYWSDKSETICVGKVSFLADTWFFHGKSA